MTEQRTYTEIQEELSREIDKLKQPLSDKEEEAVLIRIIELQKERKGAVNE